MGLKFKFSYEDVVFVVLIGVSNYFEVAIVIVVMLFGFNFGVVLVIVVGVLIEVLVMLMLVEICKKIVFWFFRDLEKVILLDFCCIN